MDLPVIGPVLKKIFGSANDRMVARYLRLAKQVSELEPSVRPLTDAEIKAKTGEFRSRLADGASISDLTPEASRELSTVQSPLSQASSMAVLLVGRVPFNAVAWISFR